MGDVSAYQEANPLVVHAQVIHLDNPATGTKTQKGNSSSSMRMGNESEFGSSGRYSDRHHRTRFETSTETLSWSHPDVASGFSELRDTRIDGMRGLGFPPFLSQKMTREMRAIHPSVVWTKAQAVHSPGHPNTHGCISAFLPLQTPAPFEASRTDKAPSRTDIRPSHARQTRSKLVPKTLLWIQVQATLKHSVTFPCHA